MGFPPYEAPSARAAGDEAQARSGVHRRRELPRSVRARMAEQRGDAVPGRPSLRARNRSGGAADEARVVLAVRVLYSPVRTKKSLQTVGVRKVVASRADFEAKDGASGQEKAQARGRARSRRGVRQRAPRGSARPLHRAGRSRRGAHCDPWAYDRPGLDRLPRARLRRWRDAPRVGLAARARRHRGAARRADRPRPNAPLDALDDPIEEPPGGGMFAFVPDQEIPLVTGMAYADAFVGLVVRVWYGNTRQRKEHHEEARRGTRDRCDWRWRDRAFFGDYPRAVQTAEFFLQEACAG